MKNFFKKCWEWLRKYIFNKKSIIPALLAELVFWSPLIVLVILSIFGVVHWSTVIAYISFWALPITPAIPIQIVLITAFCGIWNKFKGDKK